MMATPTRVTNPPEDFKIIFVDRILDSVHGYIELTQIERKIIELPIFKRLQSIKQLSLVNWVFPGAEHTRYSHSLGVMYLADKMATQLEYFDGDRQLVRLAGLLHDIGHFPLSHVGESSYELSTKVENNFIERHIEKTLKKVQGVVSAPSLIHRKPVNPYHHEDIGARLIESSDEIKRLLDRYCPFIDRSNICAIITGKYQENSKLSAMVQLLHSELDADRLDYLLRDASTSGTSYGVDTGVIIKNLDWANQGDVDIVGIKPKGISATDQFLLNRFFSLSQIVCNRHVAALEFMCEAIIRHVARKEDFGFPPIGSRFLNYINQYESDPTFLRFTDHLFWNAVYALDAGEKTIKYPEFIFEFAHMLTQHREIKTIADAELTCSGFEYDKLLSAILASPPYNRLNSNDKARFRQFDEGYIKPQDELGNFLVQRFHSVNLTENIPENKYEEQFKNQFETRNGSINADNIKQKMESYKTYRLQDGIAVIDKKEKDADVHLLVDDDRSLIKSVYPLKLAILREYSIGTSDDEQNSI